jgi:superfamily I DNA/RNA helicase
LFSLAKSKNVCCWEIIKNCDNKDKIKEFKIDEDLQKGLLSFKTIIIKLQSMIQNKRVYGIVDSLIEYIKLKEYLKNDLSSLGKVNTFLERINEIEEEYIIDNDLKKFTLNDFLNITTQNYDNNNKNERDAVHLLTIHKAKGLEFKYVFIVGLEEGYYPCCSCFEEAIEEERRVLYVAITRAKTHCYISYANYRMIGEQKIKRTESRFLREIDYENIVQKIDTLNNDKNLGNENNYNQNEIQNIIGNNNIISLDENKDMDSNINISKEIIKNGRINESRYKNDKDIKFLNIKRKNEK